MKRGFALFRQPYSQRCTLVRGSVAEFHSVSALNGESGFVMAPFAVGKGQPIVVIRIDEQEELGVRSEELDERSGELNVMSGELEAMSDDYPFELFHDHLISGAFQKIVLARSKQIALTNGINPVACFQQACDWYPRLFIALVYTPQSGLWLTATPEVLLEGAGREWKTMALAGTMPYIEKQGTADDLLSMRWSDKNIQEQRLVASYIGDCLRTVSNDFMEKGPYTVRAAHLVHLRSDFSFSLTDSSLLGNILQLLHPTPAVCGLPKEATYRFILDHEPQSRSYYSGFMGMLAPRGHTYIYVSLRCMQILQNACRLYAGGGLLKESSRESEWEETESKMETMKRLLYVQ